MEIFDGKSYRRMTEIFEFKFEKQCRFVTKLYTLSIKDFLEPSLMFNMNLANTHRWQVYTIIIVSIISNICKYKTFFSMGVDLINIVR